MEINGTNEKIACEIISLLESHNCTIKQANEILCFVQEYLTLSSTVQFDEKVFESFLKENFFVRQKYLTLSSTVQFDENVFESFLKESFFVSRI